MSDVVTSLTQLCLMSDVVTSLDRCLMSDVVTQQQTSFLGGTSAAESEHNEAPFIL